MNSFVCKMSLQTKTYKQVRTAEQRLRTATATARPYSFSNSVKRDVKSIADKSSECAKSQMGERLLCQMRRLAVFRSGRERVRPHFQEFCLSPVFRKIFQHVSMYLFACNVNGAMFDCWYISFTVLLFYFYLYNAELICIYIFLFLTIC